MADTNVEFCAACGRKVALNAQFCAGCGADLGAPEEQHKESRFSRLQSLLEGQHDKNYRLKECVCEG